MAHSLNILSTNTNNQKFHSQFLVQSMYILPSLDQSWSCLTLALKHMLHYSDISEASLSPNVSSNAIRVRCRRNRKSKKDRSNHPHDKLECVRPDSFSCAQENVFNLMGRSTTLLLSKGLSFIPRAACVLYCQFDTLYFHILFELARTNIKFFSNDLRTWHEGRAQNMCPAHYNWANINGANRLALNGERLSHNQTRIFQFGWYTIQWWQQYVTTSLEKSTMPWKSSLPGIQEGW